jgi:hypothetical protein
MVGPVELRDVGANGGIVLGIGIGPPLGRQIASLEDLVGLMIGVLSVHRPEDRELVEHRSLFGKMLAQEHTGQFRRYHAERTAIFQRSVGLGIPCVDLTGSTCHP